jgi:hypothetical protein
MGWVYNVAPEVNIASDYPGILGVCFTFTFLMVIVVSLRFYVRFCARRMAADDYVMIVTMVSTVPREMAFQTERISCLALFTMQFASLVSIRSLHNLFHASYSPALIPETRYGLGLPLRLRPKESLPQYTKVSA